MFSRRTVASVALIAGLLMAIPSRLNAAEPAKIAVASIAKIFSDMQETKDLTAKLQARVASLQAEDNKKKTDVGIAKDARDRLKPDVPQFGDLNKKYVDMAIEYEVWQRQTQMDLLREQKQQMKTIYEKVEQASADVAKQDGFDAIIVQQNLDFPNVENPNISADQFRASILQHNVLYVGPKADVTSQIIALLDQRYKAAGGSGSAAPVSLPPAPAK